MHESLHVYISGMVQGVGFRHATYRRALSLGLTGWVRNHPDGGVEAVFEGERAVLEEMLAWCERGPALARVDNVNGTWRALGGTFNGFEIAF